MKKGNSLARYVFVAAALAVSLTSALAQTPPPRDTVPPDDLIRFSGYEPVRTGFSCASVPENDRNLMEQLRCQGDRCGADRQCYERAMLEHAHRARDAYREALKHLHPAVRATLGRQAGAANSPIEVCRGDIGERVIMRTMCYREVTGVMMDDAGEVRQARAERSAASLMSTLRGQSPPSFLVPLLTERCGTSPSDACFDRAIGDIQSELAWAWGDLIRASTGLAGWSMLHYRCANASGNNAQSCRGNRDWGVEYMVDPASVPYERHTSPPPGSGGGTGAGGGSGGQGIGFPPPGGGGGGSGGGGGATGGTHVDPAQEAASGRRSFSALFRSDDAEETDFSILNACQWGYDAVPRAWSEATTCRIARNNGELMPFVGEIGRLMARPSILSYFDFLRVEAVTRFMRAHRELVGRDLSDAELPSCGALREGLGRFRQTPTPSSVHDRYVATNAPAFRGQLRQGAITVRDLAAEARRNASEIALIEVSLAGMHGEPMLITPENNPYLRLHELRQRNDRIRSDIVYLFSAFPFLSAGHDHTAEPWNDLPNVDRLAAVNPITDEVMAQARAEVSRDIASAADRFCRTGRDDGVTWMDLISMPELTAPLVGTMTEGEDGNPVWRDGPDSELQEAFRFAHECATEAKGDWETNRTVAMLMGGVGCAFATVATSGALGPVCAGVFTGLAAVDFLEARSHMDLVGDCRAAGAAVCNEDDYASARGRYDAALTSLVVSGVFSAFELPMAVSQLRAAARFLSPRQLRMFAARMSAIRSRQQFNLLVDDITAAARVEGASADDLARLAEAGDPPGTTAPGMGSSADDALRAEASGASAAEGVGGGASSGADDLAALGDDALRTTDDAAEAAAPGAGGGSGGGSSSGPRVTRGPPDEALRREVTSHPSVRAIRTQNARFDGITREHNRAFMRLADEGSQGNRLFFDAENAVIKQLNDTGIADKEVVTALLNRYKSILHRRVTGDPRLGSQMIGQYSDFKSIRYAFREGTPELRDALARVYREANDEFMRVLEGTPLARLYAREGMRGIGREPGAWHMAGIGSTADEANAASRAGRSFFTEGQPTSMQSFDNLTGFMEQRLQRIETLRAGLQREIPPSSGLLRRVHGTAGGSSRYVLSDGAAEVLRKVKATDLDGYVAEVQGRMLQRYGVQLSRGQVLRMRDYFSLSDGFTAGLMQESRTVIDLGEATHGVVSVDFAGLGARNITATMEDLALQGGQGARAAVRAARDAERRVTQEMAQMNGAFRDGVGRTVGRDAGDAVLFSGDDGILMPGRELTMSDKQALVTRLSASGAGDPSSYRVTFLPQRYAGGGVIPAAERSSLVVQAEGVEKYLRGSLEGAFSMDDIRSAGIAVDFVPRAGGGGTVNLIVSGRADPAMIAAIRSRLGSAVPQGYSAGEVLTAFGASANPAATVGGVGASVTPGVVQGASPE